MGMKIKALKKYKRGHADLYPGKIIEVSDREGRRLISKGIAEPIFERQQQLRTAQAEQPSEQMVSRRRSRTE
jgi:hypothetical protein